MSGNLSVILIYLNYICASILFILGLKMMSSPARARRGNLLSAMGMLLAVLGTLVARGMSYHWIIAGILIGTLAGAVSAMKVPMTAMPEFVGLYNGFGGLASLLIGWAEYHRSLPDWVQGVGGDGLVPIRFTAAAAYVTIFIGGVTFSGSMVAYCKLAGHLITGRPILYRNQHIVNALVLAVIVLCGVALVLYPAEEIMYVPFLAGVVLSLLLGVLVTIPIGGADMPVAICMLNSYSGLAGCAAGFVIMNTVLIVSGSLVGASGIILSLIMCKAMNRSLANVLFGGFGVGEGRHFEASQREAKPISAADAYYLLEAADSVVFVPGYGMAVAQAQHMVRELGDMLEKNGADVKYAIHPVAGRMPGHMNVLLAEANVSYDHLFEMDVVNPIMNVVDVAIVIGANDVVNPAAREDKSSPLYGMPIIDVDKAKTVLVLKRSLASGFAGVENPLFFKENTRMLFGDAKASVQALVAEFKGN
jgi:NAD(P) transhydrogenase subunit beta